MLLSEGIYLFQFAMFCNGCVHVCKSDVIFDVRLVKRKYRLELSALL